jgi:hypothetical protein
MPNSSITDEDGNYKLSGLPAGRFTIMPLAKSYVVASDTAYKDAGQTVNVAEGETITKIDFPLVREASSPAALPMLRVIH